MGTLTQQPFPELKRVVLSSGSQTSPILPDNFLGGFTPRLRVLILDKITFPGLPKLLLSANGLVKLVLKEISTGGYFSSDAMANCLSGMSKLKYLVIEFQSRTSHPASKNRRSSSLTRTILPAFTVFQFQGTSEYLEDLVARIHAPLLNRLSVRFFDEPPFDIPQLSQFIYLTEKIKIRDYLSLDISLPNCECSLDVSSPDEDVNGWFSLTVPSLPMDRHLSCITQICDQLSLDSHLQALRIYGNWRPFWQDIPEWLDFFRLFPTVCSLTVWTEMWPLSLLFKKS
ncbi:hypothetical protein B0F90DRAFT_441216 [Multifurca ochricompacta]|uniref:Uncharacterized protein n=1 Tax=Multifurca ochricompacta TaxID=376703 RepID=A0AAD4LUS2_9AGAM|nr:hypothetical protein B0F90DRAFT_441216 [Multifurca ochricompacta]